MTPQPTAQSPGSLDRLVRRRRGRRGRMKHGWKPGLPTKPPRKRVVRETAWVEVFLPPVCADDVMCAKRFNVLDHRDLEDWHWWCEQYAWLRGRKPPNDKLSHGPANNPKV